jgi:hypothetical protein
MCWISPFFATTLAKKLFSKMLGQQRQLLLKMKVYLGYSWRSRRAMSLSKRT